MTWIFGYGSLIWRPDFPFLESRRARVSGWRRRFWQASPDHRGVPQAPGRVVTLVEEPAAVCDGVAFLAAPEALATTFAALDVREQNGYDLIALDLEFDDGSRVSGSTYVAGPENPSFVGPAPLPEMVHQIAHAQGPSGSNREYLLRLAEALAELKIEDEEVRALCAGLEAFDQRQPSVTPGSARQ